MATIRFFSYGVLIFVFLWTNLVFAEKEKVDTAPLSKGKNQIIVSPANILLDLGETASANAIVIDPDGLPVEGLRLTVVSQDKAKLKIIGGSFTTNESGYVEFSVLGKQKGIFIITVSDGTISAHTSVVVKDLIRYVLPYFYGDMQISLINPTNVTSYVKVQLHENSDRITLPVVVTLEDKEMKMLKLSEELETKLYDGWVELLSTEILFGGTWTSNGYLSFNPLQENE